jgi:Concanavalin A-like lectin/glucanases superfamily
MTTRPQDTPVLQPIYNYNAMVFALLNGAVASNLSIALDGSQSFSIGLWIRPMTIADIGQLLVSQPPGFSIVMGGALVYIELGGQQVAGLGSLTLSAWQYLLITFASNGNGGGTFTGYVDGALTGSASITSLTGGSLTATGFVLGNSVYAQCLGARLWNSALQPGSSNFLPPRQMPGPEAGLLMSVDFTQVPPIDRSGNNVSVGYVSDSEIVTLYPGLDLGELGYAVPDPADGVNPGYGSDPFSIGAWVYPTPSLLSDKAMTVVANGDAMLPNAFLSYLKFNAADNVYTWSVQRGGVVGTNISSTATLAPNTWHYVAVTYDGSTLTLYVDGQASGSVASGSIAAIATPAVQIGAAPNSSDSGGFSHSFEGYLQAVGIWSTCLTAQQVQTFMTTEPDQTSGCVAYYDLRLAPAGNSLSGLPAALFNDARISELAILSTPAPSSSDAPATSVSPMPARPVSKVMSSEPMDQAIANYSVSPMPARPMSKVMSSEQMDQAIANYEELVTRFAPDHLRQHYRDLFRRNLYTGLSLAEKDGIPAGAITFAREGESLVFHHHTSVGRVECARFAAATLDDTTAWIVSVVATSFSLLMSVLGFGIVTARIVQFLARWAAGTLNGATIQNLRLVFAQPVQAETVVKAVRSLYSAGILGSTIVNGLAGVSWWNWAFTVVTVGLQIVAIWVSGGLFLLWLLAQVLLNIAQLVYVIGQKPSGANPVPVLNGLNPGGATVGGGAFTLTVFGIRFVTQSNNPNPASPPVVNWNGSARPTTFVSETQVTAQLTAADIATAGQFQVTVANPNSNGTSNALLFTVAAAIVRSPLEFRREVQQQSEAPTVV